MNNQKVLVHSVTSGIEKVEFYIMKHSDTVVIMSYIENVVDGVVVTSVPELETALDFLKVAEHVHN